MLTKSAVASLASSFVLALLAAPSDAAFPGSNGKLAFTRTGDIYVIQADGTGLQQLTGGPARDQRPVWSPDGSQIAFESDRNDPTPGTCLERSCNWDAYVMRADGSGLKQLTTTPSPDRHPSWSPDGTKLVFDRNADCPPVCGFLSEEVWVMNADGSGQTQITNAKNLGVFSNSFDPAWSPDGTQIAFVTEENFDQVLVMNPDGSGRHYLTRDAGNENTPDWSPDSIRIAFTRVTYNVEEEYLCGRPDVFVMNRDGSGQQSLTSTPAPGCPVGLGGGQPAWSPDGAKIAFVRDPDILVMNADGSAAANVTTDPIADSAPDWQPLHEPQRGDYGSAKRYCRALRAYLGKEAFRARFGGKHAYRTCVRRNR
jgi:Tol biopolymer transport system component